MKEISISVEGQARLAKIGKQMKKPKKEVMELFNEKYAALVKKGTEGDIEKLAINNVMSTYRREVNRQTMTFKPKATAKCIIGFKIGGGQIRDRAQEMRQAAKNYAEKNGLQAARDDQLIDGDNAALDTREKVYGRPNPNYLEPLGNRRIQSNVIIGFFRVNGDKTFKYTRLQTSDNRLARAWKNVPNFKPCQTYGIVKDNFAKEMKVNASLAEDTMTVFKSVNEEWDFNKIILEAIEGETTPLGAVNEHHETFKDAWDRRIVVRGVVSTLNLNRPSKSGGIWASLIDPDTGLESEQQVRMLIPKNLAIDFGEGSEIIVFGRTFQFNDRETGKPDGDALINVQAIWPLPGLTTPKESSEAEEEEGDEIEGWIP